MILISLRNTLLGISCQIITPPTSPVTAMGLIGAANASQHHGYQHHSVGSEIVSHTPRHAHKVWSNIWEVLRTEGIWLMLTCQIRHTFKPGFDFCCLLFHNFSSACKRGWFFFQMCQFYKLFVKLEALCWDCWCLSICVSFVFVFP